MYRDDPFVEIEPGKVEGKPVAATSPRVGEDPRDQAVEHTESFLIRDGALAPARRECRKEGLHDVSAVRFHGELPEGTGQSKELRACFRLSKKKAQAIHGLLQDVLSDVCGQVEVANELRDPGEHICDAGQQ